MKVRVTQGMIDGGCKQSPRNCILALAINEALGIDDAAVSPCRTAHSPHRWRVGWDRYRKTKFLPLKAALAAEAFDEGDKVQPFEFDLDIPDERLPGHP